MSRIRSFSLPKIGSSRKQDDAMSAVASPYQSGTSHSRESSGASTSSTPVTPTFSNRSHGLWQNSNSSFGTTPESPVNLTKSPLHDLPEDPEERDDDSFDFLRDSQDGSEIQDDDGPLCICDTPFCVHQNSQELPPSRVSPAPEWTPGDDFDLSAQHSFKRQRSKERSTESLASRMSRRFPSMSKRWKDQPSTQATNASVRSAPASRTPSLRLGTRKHTFSGQGESRTPPFSPVDAVQQPSDSARTSKVIPAPIDIPGAEVEDPVDYRELASTPLLPPMMDSNVTSQRDKVQSPLQSPKIAEPADGTFAHHPRSTPNLPYIPTPPLSTKASIASFHRAGSDTGCFASDVPPMPLSDDNDPWAAKLGHANFQIMPEPYFPEQCDIKSCQRLRDDWETARKDYMRQAAPISEHYGPTSRTFKLTERKWAEIDAVWRANYELAKAQAGGPKESPECQPLPETVPLPKMTALPNDPEQPSKFPKIDESDIVGPMVQYARVQRQPTRRPSFLRLFTDPASLLGRSTFSMRR